MANVRMTIDMASGTFEWTESYVCNDSDNPGGSVSRQRGTQLANTRALLLGSNARINSVRMSLNDASRDTYILRKPNSDDGIWQGNQGLATSTGASVEVDFIPTALLVRYECGPNNFTLRYHGGCPDVVFRGPRRFDLSQFNGGRKSWDKWLSLITGGGWATYVVPPKKFQARKTVTLVAFNNLGQPMITAAGVNAAIGDSIALSGVKFNTRVSIDGYYKVVAVAGNVYTLLEPALIPPNSIWMNAGTMRINTPSVSEPISSATPLNPAAHKRGTRGFEEPHGKRNRRR